MRIACCEDERVQSELIKEKICGWCERMGKNCEIDLYNSAESFLFEQNGSDSVPYDLLLLDIAMKKMDGFSLARQLREKDKTVKIAFLTSDPSHAPEGYELNAWRYILKPVDDAKIDEMMRALCASMEKRESRYCLFEISGEYTRIDLDGIFYLEADGHYTVLHCKNRNFEIRESFHTVLEKLNDAAGLTNHRSQDPAERQSFVKCHRSIAINVSKIQKIGKSLLYLEDATQLPVSRGMYQEINQAFIRVNL